MMSRQTAVALLIFATASCGSAADVAGLPELMADSTSGPSGPDSNGRSGYSDLRLEISAEYEIVQVNGEARVRTTMVVQNNEPADFGGTSSAYPWRLVLFTDSARTQMVWHMDDYLHAIPDLGRRFMIPEGASLSFDASWFPVVPVTALRGSRPPGTYFASMQLFLQAPNLRSQPIPAGTIALP